MGVHGTPILKAFSQLDERQVTKSAHELFSITQLTATLTDRLILSLQFPTIKAREERVVGAHTRTFEWIFNETANPETWSSFANWLRVGNGLYWITGKAGSGKSTLMKFITQHPKTKSLIGSLGGGAGSVLASFYFWHAGNQMQTSQEGLLQTLLYQALHQYRSLAPDKLRGRWQSFALSKKFDEPWTWSELEKAFKFLLEDEDQPLKLCFFIDGLDEFKGEFAALLTLIQCASQYPNVKFCVSSRPWMIFEDTFRAKPQLMLQDLTSSDIRRYVKDNLTDSPAFVELRCTDEKYAASLVKNVAKKSAGVFLWVVLVVKSLVEGLRDGDHLSDLQRRLEELPKELGDLFCRILHNFDTRYFQDASILFQLVKASTAPLSILSLSLAEQANEEQAVQAAMRPLNRREKFYKALHMRRRLDSRCRGLLEVEPICLAREKLPEVTDVEDSVAGALKPELGYTRRKTITGDMRPGSTTPDEAPCQTIPLWEAFGPVIREDGGALDNLSSLTFEMAGHEHGLNDGDRSIDKSTAIEHLPMAKNSKILRNISKLKPENGHLLAKCKVEFLHRTVSDFLNRPEIWEHFLAASNNSFKPYAALTQCWLLQLKWVYSDTSFIHAVPLWDASFGVLEYAKKSEIQETTSQIRLLDELNRCAKALFTPVRGSNGASIVERVSGDSSFDWSTTNPSLPPNTTFWKLAVQCGLAKYIDDKLRESPQGMGTICSLLKEALTNFNIDHVREDGSIFHQSQPSIQVVQALLNHSEFSETTKSKWLQIANEIMDGSAPDAHTITLELDTDNSLKSGADSSEMTLPMAHSHKHRRKYSVLLFWRKTKE